MGKKTCKMHLANISGEYKRDVNDYSILCPKCHKRMDIENNIKIHNRFLEVKI